MKETQLNRLLKLVKKTGDKLVVLDQASDHATVMLSLDSYEHLVDQGPDLGWHSTHDDVPPVMPPDDLIGAEAVPTASDTDSVLIAADVAPFQEIQKAELNDEVDSHGAIPEYVPGAKKLDFSGNWATENAKPISEEDLSDVPEEEEKFYLEPVE